MRARPLILGVALSGCRSVAPADTGDTGTTDESADADSSAGPGSGSTGFHEATPCESTADCGDGFCVAPYDPGAPNPVGDPVCVLACLPTGALDRFCVDDDACCDPLVCDVTGLCHEPPGEDTTTDDGESTDSSDSDTTDTDSSSTG